MIANMVSWSTIKSLSFFFIPMFLPKIISTYRSIRYAPPVPGKPIRPVPTATQRSLLLLIAFAVLIVIKALVSSPENIFVSTQSRLQTPVDVLFTRLLSIPDLRPLGLTAKDHLLRQKLVSQESRLLYFTYGPDVMVDCIWCSLEDPLSYFYYSVPSTVIYHLFNIGVIAIATSGQFTGGSAAKWRTYAVTAALILCSLDLYALNSYDYMANSRALRLGDIAAFHWTLRTYRALSVALLDLALAGVIYLSSTNRAFVTPLSASARLENLAKLSQNTANKLAGVGIVKNTVLRDADLRDRLLGYWVHEGRVMNEAMEDGEVVEGVRNALSSRVNVTRCSEDAGTWAQNIIGDFLKGATAPAVRTKHD